MAEPQETPTEPVPDEERVVEYDEDDGPNSCDQHPPEPLDGDTP